MNETIQLGDMSIAVRRKQVKNVHLAVHPPNGRVTITAPTSIRLEIVRAYAASKLAWIYARQNKYTNQARETKRKFVTRESHYVWGQRYLMKVSFEDEKPSVTIGNKEIRLKVRPGSSEDKRAEVMNGWHKSLLHEAVPPLIQKWEGKLKVKVAGYHLQRMKTKWGSCNKSSRTIRLNSELVKKPKDLLEYVIVHEMIHLIEYRHGERFIALLDRHYPSWREARAELNELPLGAEVWKKEA